MRTKNAAHRLLEEALDIAARGVDEAEVALLGGTSAHTAFVDNEISGSVELSRDVLSVRVIKGGRVGRVETTDISREGLEDALRRARMFAQFLPPPREPVSLPGPQTYSPVAEAFDRPTERATAADRVGLAARAILAASREGLIADGHVESRSGSTLGASGAEIPYAILNTNGLQAFHTGTRARFAVGLRSARQAPAGVVEAEAPSIADLDVRHAVEVARRRASREAPRAVSSLEAPVVFEPGALAPLLKVLAESSGAEDLRMGRSHLADRVGARVTSAALSLEDDFAHPLHRGAPFDAEGVARKKVKLIDDGVLGGPLYSHGSAKLAGVAPTGHRSIHPTTGEREIAEHLVMRGGDATLGDLIGGLRAGVYVTSLAQVEVEDPRRLEVYAATLGAYAVERGELVAPIESLSFRISLFELFSRLEGMTAAGLAGGVVAPAARFGGLALVGGRRA